MIQDNRNIIGKSIILVIIKEETRSEDDDSKIQKCYWSWNYLSNYKEGDDKVRMTMIQEYRNVIGNEIILVITKNATTK